MKNILKYFLLNIAHFGGILQERCMEFRFNVSHFIKHRRKPVRMNPDMYKRFKKYVNGKKNKK